MIKLAVFGHSIGTLWSEYEIKYHQQNKLSYDNVTCDSFKKLPDWLQIEIHNLRSYCNMDDEITIHFDASKSERGSLSRIKGAAGRKTVEVYTLPSNWDISLELEIDIEDQFSGNYTKSITIPWNYSFVSGNSTQILLPFVLDVIQARHDETVQYVKEQNALHRDRKANAKKELEKNELEILNTLAKKYKKTVI